MNILIALIPAFFWGILPLVVRCLGGTPIQQILGTTCGTFLLALCLWFFLPSFRTTDGLI